MMKWPRSKLFENERIQRAREIHVTKELLNASVDGIMCIGLNVCKDEGLHIHILNEGRHRDEARGGNTSIWCNNLSLLYLEWQL